MTIKPYGAMLLIQEDEVTEKKTTSGLVIAAAFANNELKTGKIVAIGNGEHNYKGELISIQGIDLGDIVYYPTHSGTNIEDEDGKKYLLLNAKNVLAIK